MRALRHAFLLIAGIPSLLAAQSFVNDYGGSLAQDGVGVVQTPGGFAVAVRDVVGPEQQHRAWILRTSGGGMTQSWSPMDELQGNVFLQSMARSSSDEMFAAGSTIPTGASEHEAFVVKYDPDGNVAWVASGPSSAQYFDVAPMPDGGAVACGVHVLQNGHDRLVSRLSGDGDVLWSITMDGALDEEAYAIAVEETSILVTGRQLNFSGGSDVWIARTDLDGNLLWTSSWGGEGNEEGRGITRLDDGVFLVAGTTNSYGMRDTTEGRVKDNIYLIAVDLAGDTLWTRALGDTLYDRRGLCLDMTAEGDLLVAGERAEVTGESDALVLRLSHTGELQWERVWHVGKEDRLLDIRALPDGLIAAGWAFTDQARQVLLLRRDPNGN